jgi:hypothetical protein
VGLFAPSSLRAEPPRGAVGAALPRGTWDDVLPADLDDDDFNGVSDALDPKPSRVSLTDAVPVPDGWIGGKLTPIDGAALVRMVVPGRVLPWGVVPRGAMLQGVSPGLFRATLESRGATTDVSYAVSGARAIDASGATVDPLTRVAMVRSVPSKDGADAKAPFEDEDAFRFMVTLPVDGQAATPQLRLRSFSPKGVLLDTLDAFEAKKVDCEKGSCFTTPALRLVVDDVDRQHPLIEKRSLRGEVGGAVALFVNGRKHWSARVGGPRSLSGPARYRLKIRAIVMRATASGSPSVGGNDKGAIALVRSELAYAAALWGQCGISFGPSADLEVRVENPPEDHLVAFANDGGVWSGGGELKFRVDGKSVTVAVPKGAQVEEVADAFVGELGKIGFKGLLSRNARTLSGAKGSVDVSVRSDSGKLAKVEWIGHGFAVDVGHVDLGDGLNHFTDVDSPAGTLEERTLVKAFDDGDPTVVKLFVVPSFGGGGRIGESFIASDGSSMRGIVMLDRAGIRARRSSYTLAHELGHVLLDEPGHPDDFVGDTPSRLMDSDASDPSAYGPRRLLVEECKRVILQSGPKARVPVLDAWPLEPLSTPITSR